MPLKAVNTKLHLCANPKSGCLRCVFYQSFIKCDQYSK